MNKSILMRQALEAARQALTEGDHRDAIFQAKLAVAMARDIDEGLALADALSLLTHHLWALGRFEPAVQAAEEAAEQWRRLGNVDAECEMLCLLAGARSELASHELALVTARLAFDLARRCGIDARVLQSLAMMATMHSRLGDHDEAEHLLLNALSRARELDDAEAMPRTINTLLVVLVQAHDARAQAGQAEAAAAIRQRLMPHARHALRLSQREPSLFRRSVMQSNVAAAFMADGRLDDAHVLLDACIARSRVEGFRTVELKSRHRRAQCLLLAGDADAARAELDDLMLSLSRQDATLAREDTLQLLGRVAHVQEHVTDERLHLDALDSLAHAREQRHDQARPRLHANAAQVEDALNPADSAWLDTVPGPDLPGHLPRRP